MATHVMHLARKWRSQTFQTIKGQDLVVRILQNNLYRGYFFPLYLFAGPRGSGKTSTARIFAAAANCQEIEAFRQAPRSVHIPCHNCASCQALFTGSHPDIVEIDAASYTGVDNVRSIIDSATFLPVMGHKKVYIIDEAHMLSKAAFNAFLKILEEPPQSAIFILATTDPSKILNTVQSRSLQLYFEHVDERVLYNHLAQVCDEEQIPYESSGIARLSHASQGSIRDALQLLERVYLAAEHVTRDAVIHTLGEIDEQMIIEMLDTLAHYDMQNFMQYVHSLHLEQYAPMRVWNRIIQALRALFWGHFGISDSVWEQIPRFYDIVHLYHTDTLRRLLDLAYAYETYMLKTTYARALLEMLLFECKRIYESDNTTVMQTTTPSSSVQSQTNSPARNGTNGASHDSESAALHNEGEHSATSSHVQSGATDNTMWSQVVAQFEQEGDPLLASVFKQAHDVQWDDAQTLRITCARELQFYHEWMQNHTSFLKQLVQRICNVTPEIIFQFADTSLQTQDAVTRKRASPSSDNGESSSSKEASFRSNDGEKKKMKPARSSQRGVTYETIPDINDTNKWPFAHVVMQAFPGAIKRVKKRE